MKEPEKENDKSIRQLEINNLKFELNPHTFKNIPPTGASFRQGRSLDAR